MTSIRPVRRITRQQWNAARAEGYSDDEIRAEGYELDEPIAAPKAAKPKPTAPVHPLANLGKKVAAGARGAFDAVTFGGSDELLAAMMPGKYLGRGFSERTEALKASRQRQKAENPTAYTVGEVAGMLAPVAGAGGAAARAGKSIAKSAVAIGAGQGALTGALSAEGNRLTGGAVGGVGGAILGPVAGKLVQGGSKLVGPAVSRVMSKLPSRAAATPTIPDKALQFVAKKLADDGVPPDAIADAVARFRAGDPELLLNLGGENVVALARVVQSLPGRGKTVVQEALDRQAVEVPELISEGVERAIGKPVPNVVARQDELAAMAAKVPKPLYEAIEKKFITSPTLDDLTNAPAVQRALRSVDEGFRNRRQAVPDGWTVGKADRVKKILDGDIKRIETRIEKGDATGAEIAAKLDLEELRGMLVKEVDDLTNQAYAKAREEAAAAIGMREAFREGTGALRQRGAQLQARIGEQTPTEQALGLEGAATDVVERMTARDPARAASVFDPKTRRNLDLLTQQLPKARAEIKGTYERAGRLQKQAQASTMRGQSTTAATTAGQAELEGAAGHILNAVDPGGAITFGLKPMMVRVLAKAMRQKARMTLGRGSEEVAGEIADILTKRLGDPVESSDVLRLLNQAMTQQAVQKAQATGRRAAAGALGGQAAGRVP